MKICVIGTGTMAKGIVKAFAAKMPVVMKSRTQASLDKAMASIAKGYGKLVEKGKMTQEAVDALLKNITTTTDYATFADADLVIEAAVEEMQLKKDVFNHLRYQLILTVDHRDRCLHQPSRSVHRHALLQSRRPHGPRGSHQGSADQR